MPNKKVFLNLAEVIELKGHKKHKTSIDTICTNIDAGQVAW